MPEQSKKVMISSTARDLPEHRKEVMDACLRQGMLPKMMEHLPANDAEAIGASLKMVDEADIYVAVFAHRYGYVPTGYDISVTEMEYNRAVERKIPRMIFVIDKAHPITIDDVERGEGAAKLKAFKERVQTENIVNFFKSPADLRAHVINSLSQLREPDLTTFHYVSEIPAPPEAFIAHPYTLLQSHRMVGRQKELNLLTDWVTSRQNPIYDAHILSVVAIGGLGKSALTWKWFNDIVPQEMKPLAGRMWWSFYESDATFENFVTRALAYVTKRGLDDVQKIPAPEREVQLLAALDREPFLIVLDGLERMLIAYARMDAAHLADDEYDKQTANYVANAYGLPASVAQSVIGQHQLRKTVDLRAGAFLRKLSNVRAARILVSTRLYPADLQTVTGESLGSCAAIFLHGLADDDALELWRAIGVSGARDALLPLFNRVDNHPLLIQSLASEVARYRRAPGDYDQWRRDHPGFNPFSLSLVSVKSHVLEFALRGLDDRARQALQVIAAFRMPARYDTLTALLMGEGKPCADERELDAVLTELEDRGLVGWDKRANRYDLHPIVRGVVWSGLGDDTRRGVYTSLHAHFDALPKIDNWHEVSSLEDLTPPIELYNTLIGLGRYDDAAALFIERLEKATLLRLSANSQRIELLESLFPDGLDELPRLSRVEIQARILNTLALVYQIEGQHLRALSLYRRHNNLCKKHDKRKELCIGLRNLSDVLRLSGHLCESAIAALNSILLARKRRDRIQEAISLQWLGLTEAVRGKTESANVAICRSLHIFTRKKNNMWEGLTYESLAQISIWLADFYAANSLANQAWHLASLSHFPVNIVRSSQRQAASAIGLNHLNIAEERLHYCLGQAREISFIEEELIALAMLAQLRRRQSHMKAAREFLDDVWEAAERGPYPLIHADARNVLAQIERDAGNHAAAIEAATQAYNLAWCDGPPFAYHWGLVAARKHLQELGAPEPQLPPFDASKFEPMPDVEIDPDDEFHAGKQADD
jgi:hypothetical protein